MRTPGDVMPNGYIVGREPGTMIRSGTVYINASAIADAERHGWRLRSRMGGGMAMVER